MVTSSTPTTRRYTDWYVAAMALLVGLPFTYLGAKGLLAYFRGVREAPADPLAGSIGLLGGVWMLLMAARLLRRRDRRESLFGQTELFWASLLAIILGVSAMIDGDIGMHREFLFPVPGLGGLVLWWIRRGRSRLAPPAA
jgi:hypothetical protein